MGKKGFYYIDKEEFYNLIKDYQKTGCKKSYEKIGKNILLMVNGIAHNQSFLNWDENTKAEMISDAIYRMIKNIHRFDCEKYTNPFGYFSMIAYHCFQKNINYAKKRAERIVTVDFIENINNSYDGEDEIEVVNYNKCDNVDRYDATLDYINSELKKLNSYIDKGE